MRRCIACIGLLVWLAGSAYGEDHEAAEPSSPTPPAEPSEDQATNTQDEAADEQAAADEQDAPPPEPEEVFIPSENISEDIAVPLPVDI